MRIVFWSVLEHHALALRPIYNKMKAQGKDVVDLFNHPRKDLGPFSCIVSGSAADLPVSKRQCAIYHFHSLSPYHTNPGECDYQFVQHFKGVMFPGEWWIDKWPKKPVYWAVVGWPKNDLLLPATKHEATVLYASSMFDFQRMRTLRLLISLSEKLNFDLTVKPHHGTAKWFPYQFKAASETARLEASTSDIAGYFPLADVLVSEASGALWEFMATGRPSIQMRQGEHWGRIYPGGILRATFDTLEETLESALKDPEMASSEIALWCDKVMGKLDGKATDRAIAFIEETFG